MPDQGQESQSPFSLSTGQRLGPYEIVAPIDAGGMGEVYRARDPRLGRDVALKVLHPSFLMTAEHVERFGREARAAGSLNHPNIVAVFDVGTDGSIPYVVSELLEGESLRARLTRGPLAYRKALEIAIQIAQALGAAHAKGIFHRDVKPANIFITTDGQVKLLDFGLAKLKELEIQGGSDESTADRSQVGAMRGTAGYMSPEQIRGLPVDHRTDIFGMGAVLYEMFTGARAFQRNTPVDAMAAALNEDPIDPLELNSSLPPAAAVTVRRCLEKNREERFQSARDLAFHLQQLLDAAAKSGREAAARPLFADLRIRIATTVALLVVAAAILVPRLRFLRSAPALRPAPPSSIGSFERLTFSRGRIGGARFAPGGQAAVYSEARDGEPLQVRRVELTDQTQADLGYPPATDILATRPREYALSVGRRFFFGERFLGTLAVAPPGGSPLGKQADVEDADYDSSGRLVAARVTGIGEGTSLEYPLDHQRYSSGGSIRFPRISPDDRRIAFLEDPSWRGFGGRVMVLNLEDNHVKPLGELYGSARGLAWSPTGDEIWFAAGKERAHRLLRAVDLNGNSRELRGGPDSLTLWDIARNGNVLVTHDEERRGIVGVAPGEAKERDLPFSDFSAVAGLSEDGQWLLYGDRPGIYLSPTNRSAPPKLLVSEGWRADDLSRDAKWALATSTTANQLLIIPTEASKAGADPKPVDVPGLDLAGAWFFPDLRRILVNGKEAGRPNRSWILDVENGKRQPLTPEGTWGLAISPKGDRVAGIGQDGIYVWPLKGGDGKHVPHSRNGDRPAAWTRDGHQLWVFRRGEVPGEAVRIDVATGSRMESKVLMPADPAGVYNIVEFHIALSANAYFYSYQRTLSQLWFASGLK